MPTPGAPGGIDRRTVMGLCSAAGMARGLPAAPAVLAAQGPQASQAPPKITKEMLVRAEGMIGLDHRRDPQTFG